MNRLRLLLPVLLLAAAPLAGCATVPPPLPADAQAVTAIPQISGQWDILEFAGKEPRRRGWDGTRIAHMDFTADGDLSAHLACNALSTRVVVDDGRLRDAPGASGIITAAGCHPEATFTDDDLLEFLATDPQMTLLPDGTLRLDGGGKMMLLERPGQWRLRHGRPVADLLGDWEVVHLSTGRFEDVYFYDIESAPVRIAADGLALANCPAMAVPVAYTPDFRFESRVTGPAKTDPPGCAPTQHETMVHRLFHTSPSATIMPQGTLVLEGGGMSLALVRPKDRARLFPED